MDVVALRVGVLERHRAVAAHAHEQKREAHAVVPHRERLRARPGDLGVIRDERALGARAPVGRARQVERDHALAHADLRRGHGAAEAVLRTERLERRREREGLALDLRIVDPGDAVRDLAEPRIAEEEDVPHRAGYRTTAQSTTRMRIAIAVEAPTMMNTIPPFVGSVPADGASGANGASP